MIIDPACDLKTAAKRILWGKVVNAGQTCVAPDYVLVPKDFQDKFCDALKETYVVVFLLSFHTLSDFNFLFSVFSYEEFYPDAEKRSAAPGTYSRLVTPQATNRVAGLLEKTKGTVVFGGEVDKDNKYIAPTLVKDVQHDDSLMSEYVLF